MAVPRPVLLAVLGLALVSCVFLVTRSGSNESVTQATKMGEKPAPALKAPAPSAHTRPAHRAAPTTASKPVANRPAKPRPVSGVPAEVERAASALGQGKVVVLFFGRPGAADDTATRQSVQSLQGVKGVAVSDASFDRIAAYRPMLSGLGISQVPATVIVRPGRRAVLFQGFVDSGTLRQNVADAQR